MLTSKVNDIDFTCSAEYNVIGTKLVLLTEGLFYLHVYNTASISQDIHHCIN